MRNSPRFLPYSRQKRDAGAVHLLSEFAWCNHNPWLKHVIAGAVPHDQVMFFLSGHLETSANLWPVVKPSLRQIEPNERILNVEDSIEEKSYSVEHDIICWQYGPFPSRNVKGIDFLTALYHSQGVSLSVAFHLANIKEEAKPPTSRIYPFFCRYAVELSETMK
jgi:hypothetical protein